MPSNSQPVSTLPDIHCIIIDVGPRVTVINLDNVQNPEIISSRYIAAIEQYGKDKVRYCKVVTTSVKTEVSFNE